MHRFIPDPALARPAGALYLAIIALGLTGEFALRGALLVPGDAAATAANLAAAPGTLRLSLAADTAMALADVAVAVLLFFLFRALGALLAALAAAFRLIQTAVIGANLLNLQAAILWATGDAPPELSAQMAHGALELQGFGYDLGLAFFGVTGVMLGLLLMRAAARILGPLMLAAGAVYLTGSGLRILAPGLAADFEPAYLVCLVAELSLALWLVTRSRPRAARSPGRGMARRRPFGALHPAAPGKR